MRKKLRSQEQINLQHPNQLKISRNQLKYRKTKPRIVRIARMPRTRIRNQVIVSRKLRIQLKIIRKSLPNHQKIRKSINLHKPRKKKVKRRRPKKER